MKPTMELMLDDEAGREDARRRARGAGESLGRTVAAISAAWTEACKAFAAAVWETGSAFQRFIKALDDLEERAAAHRVHEWKGDWLI